jgi:hypothetical protein
MGNMARFQGIFEGSSHEFLARKLVKGSGPPPGGGYFIHGVSIACFQDKKKSLFFAGVQYGGYTLGQASPPHSERTTKCIFFYNENRLTKFNRFPKMGT